MRNFHLLPSKHSFRLAIKKDLQQVSLSHIEPEPFVVETVDVSEVDTNKRSFLKLAGIAGLGIVASQMLPKKSEAYVLGSTPTSNVVGVKDSSNTRIDPATNTTLTGVKTQTDKLIFDGSSNLYVQAASNFSSQLENTSNTVINPATEDTLALIKTQTNKLTFDVSGKLLTSGSGAGTASQLQDTTGTTINPSTDDSVILLRRMVKLMESQAAVDSGNRQRITLDSLGTGTAVTTTVPVSGTVTATVTGATLGSGTVANATIATIAGQNDQMYQDIARNAYANSIRQNLVFS